MKSYSIKDCQLWASQKGGKCLSEKYFNMRHHLSWECSRGHVFKAAPYHVKDGKWCRECSYENKRLDRSTILARIPKDGKLLSKKYINSSQKLTWQCGCGFVWEASWTNIHNGKWCPRCAGNHKKNINDMKLIAKERGGYCLSDEYINIKTHLSWKCIYGHMWMASPEKILSGRWCPECNNSIGERICRSFFEQLFNEPFPKLRPKWLVNHDGNRMELDGFSEKLKIAFEHHGDQHFKLTHFHKSKKDFDKRLESDTLKKKLCNQHGVKLVEIPQIFSRIEIKDLKKIIGKQLGTKIPEYFQFDLNKVFFEDKLEPYRKIANRHGGIIISKQYLGNKSKLLVRCKCGREWWAWPSNLKKGHWCASCSNKRRKNESSCYDGHL